ncbi:MAG: protein-L-isoaspartate O-methyltransferase [Thermohalobaculum sp.]|nr:protein-L-isoaspartate O-methyltransferase [Thermohalobaculum sp.]
MTDFADARRAMVDCQVRPSDVTRYSIIEAMLWAPREMFVPKARREIAYAEAEIPVAPGRVMMPARVFAKMLEAAAIGPGDLVLDLAPGTGYSTAVIARMAEAVVAVEPDPQLASAAQGLLDHLEVMNTAVSAGDPRAGDPAHGPYDAILINGGVAEVPQALLDQLKDGGRLVAIFAQGAAGQCRIITRAGATFSERYVFDASAPVLAGFERAASFAF